jgi:1-hydroxycarotenoid 3,4-desaturase
VSNSARSRPVVAVVGGGIAGLSAALDLAVHGCAVTLFERAALPGGKLRRIVDAQGVGVDAGPTVLTLRGIFAELFRDAGTELSQHLQLLPLEILARHAWSAHERLDLFADTGRSAAAISDFAGQREGRGYLRFCADARRVFAALDEHFMRAPRPSLARLIGRAGLRGLPDLLRLRPFTALWQALGDYFQDPRLRQLFARYATYCGSSPFEAPATLMLVAHAEQAGIWQIAGGMQALATALAELLRARGATLRCDTAVRQVHLGAGRVQALELADGERLPVTAVVMTCDAAALAAGLFGAEAARAARPVALAERSLSALTWTANLPTAGFELLHHNVFFSADYVAEFAAIRARRMLPEQPTVYICAQDRQTPQAPSPGEPERLLCLVNAPANGDLHNYGPAEVELCLTRTLATLQRCGLRLQSPAQLQPTTPTDFNRLFPGSGGALYGQATHGWRDSFRRPGPRTRVPGLYLAGGSTHPGPGLPMAALSGRNAARCLLQDQGLTRR